jgi:hypothetical protein
VRTRQSHDQGARGDRGGSTLNQILGFVTGRAGYYYIALNPAPDPGDGHAIGAVTTAVGEGRVFDPNQGELMGGAKTTNYYAGALRVIAGTYAQDDRLTFQLAMRVLPPNFAGLLGT